MGFVFGVNLLVSSEKFIQIFLKFLLPMPNIGYFLKIRYNYDLIIKIQCENLDQFNDFLQEFRERYGKFLNQTVTMVCTENLV